jgi:tetratricopeptide (TPR) repeat protein
MSPTESLARSLLCATLCFLACGSKETGVAAFAILALWRFCFGSSGAPVWWRATLLASLAATATFLALRFSLETQNSRVFENRPDFIGGSLFETLKNLPVLWSIHARNFFNPAGLCADYGVLSTRGLSPLEAWTGFSAIAIAALFAGFRSRRAAFCLGFTFLALLPASNLLPMYRPVADRYMYLPLVGLGLLLATICSHPFRFPWAGTTLRAAAVLFIAAMAVAAWHRQFVWRDSQTLWTDTADKNPRSFNAWLGLAYDSQRRGLQAESKPYLLRANELARGGDPDVWLALAVALDAEGKSDQAKEVLERALALNPDLRNPEERAARAVMEIHHARDVRQILEKYSPESPE